MRGWSHDGTLGRVGELRGHSELVSPRTATHTAESVILDERNEMSPSLAVQRKLDTLLGTVAHTARQLSSMDSTGRVAVPSQARPAVLVHPTNRETSGERDINPQAVLPSMWPPPRST